MSSPNSRTHASCNVTNQAPGLATFKLDAIARSIHEWHISRAHLALPGPCGPKLQSQNYRPSLQHLPQRKFTGYPPQLLRPCNNKNPQLVVGPIYVVYPVVQPSSGRAKVCCSFQLSINHSFLVLFQSSINANIFFPGIAPFFKFSIDVNKYGEHCHLADNKDRYVIFQLCIIAILARFIPHPCTSNRQASNSSPPSFPVFTAKLFFKGRQLVVPFEVDYIPKLPAIQQVTVQFPCV